MNRRFFYRLVIMFIVVLQCLCGLFLDTEIAYAKNEEFDVNSITTKSFVLLDAETGAVILSKQPTLRVTPSSTTKIMTALLLLESKDDLSENITVGEEVNPFNEKSSLMGLKQNETVALEELLYGMMIVSGNDAANAVAVALTEKSGDYNDQLSGFSEIMNDKAKELGMNDTHFVSAHGLYDENHYSTAQDMAILAREAMNNETFRTVVSTKEYTFKKTNLNEERSKYNTNKLLIDGTVNQLDGEFVYEYCTGIKTGLSRDDEGKMSGSLLASAEKDGRTLILAIMGDTSTEEKDGKDREALMRFREAKKIFEYGFSTQTTDITNLISNTALSATLPGEQEPRSLMPILPNNKAEYIGTDDSILDALGEINELEYQVSFENELAPPYENNQIVGTITYTLNDSNIFSCPATITDLMPPTLPTNEIGNDNGNDKKTANLSNNRSFMIAMLSVALMCLIVLFARVVTAPRRKRRKRKLKNRYY